ncbi:MAG: dehydrogenase [Alphaproteobacteria bacterium]|nr:dehydrogenase [Alphaproteobacteria bacterium]HCP01011.1 gfo/Idh/MocA family oxidoreductase [Rhodospirillaceae bacterium]
MTQRTLNALIIGCGHIAGGAGLPKLDDEALSHVGAFARHPGFRVEAGVDPDATRRTAFVDKGHAGHGFETLSEALESGLTFDVASVCAPSEQHASLLWQLLDSNIRLVLCEKPLTTSTAESERIVTAFAEAGKLLGVAYTRRWHRAIEDISAELAAGQWGRVRSVLAHYTRGVRNTGGHVIDLLHMLIGPMSIRYAGNPRFDYSPDDPTLDAVLIAGDGIAVHLVGGDGRDYGLLEVQIMTEAGSITFEDWTTRVRRRKISSYRYAPHISTLEAGEWQEYGAGGSFEAMIDNIYRTVVGGEKLACDGSHAIAAEHLIDALIATATPGETAA